MLDTPKQPIDVIVYYPEDLHLELNSKVLEAVGIECDSSGAQFGQRMIRFPFERRKDAKGAVERVGLVHSSIKTTIWRRRI